MIRRTSGRSRSLRWGQRALAGARIGRRAAWLLAVPILLTPAGSRAQGADAELRVANLGTCQLESGEQIRDCRIGFRTAGQLNADRSNAVLFPSWFGGGSQSIIRLVGPGQLIDTSRWYVIAVDPFGNGVSSSPSNSPAQAGSSFPTFTIRDMVHMQHRFVQEVLGLERLHAVVGISMGGMQAFEWAIHHPDFIQKAVSIVGTPQLSSYDLLFWETLARNIEQCQRTGCENPAVLHQRIMAMANRTPQERVRITSRAAAREWLDNMDRPNPNFDADNTLSQLRAMLSHDVTAPFGGSWEAATEAIRADVLVISAAQDHTVRPEPARDFARLLGAQYWESDSDCGHQIFSCETGRIGEVVNPFLELRKQ